MFPIMSPLGSPPPLICNISPSHSVYLLMFDIISCLNELSTLCYQTSSSTTASPLGYTVVTRQLYTIIFGLFG